ncbi:transcriptional regulator [Enterocloster clostridioformis]|nr:transcriptional regulator [Lachnoclostridium sp. YL32]NDO29525.1 transcriptional regulator [Enterocloster clostridioformis]OXE69067.1 transcriptional regulator [Enterocloster clostridioformis]QQR02890.1 transcriptional regulator [Enterocloster clostridioformis]
MGNVIKQTNRTLLMEQINPEKPDFLTVVGDVRGLESLSDDKIKEINDHLMVRSFDEVIEKFSPTVYCYFNANNQKVVYQLDKPEGVPEEMLTEIPLNRQNEFMGMLMSMVDTKRSEGTINVDFKFERLTDMISPRKVMDAIRQNRKELQYTYGEYAKLDEGDPKKLDIADKLNVMFEEASANYNNVMAMLPLAIEDTKTRLLLGDGGDKRDNTPLALGVLSMGEGGELRILEAPKVETTALATVDDNVNTGLIEALKDDYEAISGESNEYVEALVARTFCPLASTMESRIDKEMEVANYNSYLEFYKESKDAFIQTVKPLIEKLLGIWCFFEQYPKKIKGMKPSLLVTNISNEMLAKSSNISRLITFLNTTNAKNDFTNTVWYSIIPDVSLDQYSKMKLTRERFKGNSKTEKTDVNSVESLTRLLDVFKDYGVQCFFSYEADDSTTFNALATEGIEKYEDRCASLIGKAFSEYAIPCIPNFTIIPKDKSGVVLDSRMVINDDMVELSKEKEDIMKIWIDGVYVGAAYVAAGIVAAYQCPEYLKDKFAKAKVDPELPGVRFDIEADDHGLVAYTIMAKEITGFTNSIKNDINRKNFGFVFSSENAAYKGYDITNIMVYKARNLMSDGYMFEPIYKTQVTNYIERVMRHGTGDFKEDSIVQFFSNNPNSQKSQWLSKKEYLNGVLGKGDDIDYIIDEENGYCTLNITFNGNVKNLEVEINRLSANKA